MITNDCGISFIPEPSYTESSLDTDGNISESSNNPTILPFNHQSVVQLTFWDSFCLTEPLEHFITLYIMWMVVNQNNFHTQQ
jgi:hypothetical protein